MTKLEDKLISVIIPAYNAEKYIEKTIKSVLAQSYGDIEIVIVDDCSKDGTRNILRRYEKMYRNVTCVYFEKNSGASAARNAGLKAAKGRYIAFLDSDDSWERDKLKRQMREMAESGYAFSFTAHDYVDETGRNTGKKIKIKTLVRYKDLLTKTMIATSGVMIDRKALGADFAMPSRRTGQDYAFWLQLLRRTDAYGIDEPLTHICRRGGSLSGNKLQNIKDVWEVQTINEKIAKPKAAINVARYCIYALTKRLTARL